jgi:hypothetical protein
LNAQRQKNIQKKLRRIHDFLRETGNSDRDLTKLLGSLAPIEVDSFYERISNFNLSPTAKEQREDNHNYIRPPPNILEFVTSDYYLGKSLRPIVNENIGLFPAWKDILIKDFDTHSRVHNCVITGALGTGKSYVSVALLLYKITLATLLKNPQAFFGGMSKSANMIYNIMSVTREAVRQTAFGDAMNFMSNSPYFLNELNYDPDKEYSKSIIPLRNNIFLTAGSRGWHILGRNVLGVLLDEGNFRLEANPDQQAYALYDTVRKRISGRFEKREGFLPAISIIASSAQDESSFTERVIRDIEKSGNPYLQNVYRLAVYQARRQELQLPDGGGRWFKVAYGLKNREPQILGGWFTEAGALLATEGAEELAPTGCKTELVPELYYAHFRRNARAATQDICGIAVGGSHRLFATMVEVERCLELSEAEGLANPVTGQLRFIPMSSEDNKQIWDYLHHPTFAIKVASRVQPKRHPNALRYAHLDLAETTKAGLSICHLVGAKKIDGVVASGKPFDEYRLVVEYDFILTITAGQIKSISFEKICKFFFWLKDLCNFRFGSVTADQFQSTMPLQILEAAGFKVDRLSIDKDKSVYTAWRSAVEDLRLRLYRSDELMDEIELLMEGEKRFDHPDFGSKDTADSAVGAYYGAINSDERTTLLTEANPSVHMLGGLGGSDPDKPIIEISLPSTTGRKIYPKAA